MIALLLAGFAIAAPWDETVPEGPSSSKVELPRDPGPRLVPQGYRIGAVGGYGQVGTGLAAVLGAHGGTNAVHVAASYATETWGMGARLPFAAYRVQDGRSTELGNLTLAGHAILGSIGAVHQIGAEVHLNPGGRPWTWAHRAEELWPGGGVDAVWQVRTTGDLAWLGRGALGVHGAREFAPFPALWVRAAAAGGVDWSATGALGLTAEVSAAWWEISPLELTGFVRAAPVEGLQCRAGVLLPITAWAGATPTSLPSGVREVTLLADLTASL